MTGWNANALQVCREFSALCEIPDHIAIVFATLKVYSRLFSRISFRKDIEHMSSQQVLGFPYRHPLDSHIPCKSLSALMGFPTVTRIDWMR